MMFWLAACPPMFFYIMNPRVEAIEDTKNGKYNPDCWNGVQELSKDDVWRDKVAKVYFLIISLTFTGLLFVY